MALFKTLTLPFVSSVLADHSERRSSPRFQWHGTAVITILPNGPDVLGALLDLSEGGCGIEIGITIPAQVGTRVELDLNARGVKIKRKGIIRRIDVVRRIGKETHVGVQFSEVSVRNLEQLHKKLYGPKKKDRWSVD